LVLVFLVLVFFSLFLFKVVAKFFFFS